MKKMLVISLVIIDLLQLSSSKLYLANTKNKTLLIKTEDKQHLRENFNSEYFIKVQMTKN